MPGIGTLPGFCASSQASAIRASGASIRVAVLPSRSINVLLGFMASCVKGGRVPRRVEMRILSGFSRAHFRRAAHAGTDEPAAHAA